MRMTKTLFAGSLLLALLASCAGNPKPADQAAPAAPAAPSAPVGPVLLGYAPEGVPTPEQLSKLTHVIAFSLQVNDDGTLVDSSVTKDYPRLVKAAHDAGVKALVSIGGWGRSGGFSAVVASPETRAKFVANVKKFLDDNGFDGFDVDWEYPKPEEMADYATLAEELKAAIGDRLLTSAIGLGHKPSEFDPRFFKAMDLLMIMSYDWGWAPENVPVPEPHAPDSLLKFLDAWDDYAPKSKIVFGIPFYARSNANWGDWLSWADVSERFSPDADANDIGGYNFNGVTSVRRKVSFTISNCYAGLMVWHIGQDMDAKADRSLLNVMRAEFDAARERANCAEVPAAEEAPAPAAPEEAAAEPAPAAEVPAPEVAPAQEAAPAETPAPEAAPATEAPAPEAPAAEAPAAAQ